MRLRGACQFDAGKQLIKRTREYLRAVPMFNVFTLAKSFDLKYLYSEVFKDFVSPLTVYNHQLP